MDPPDSPVSPSAAAAFPNLLDDSALAPVKTNDKAAGEADTCRICRSEGSDTEPLFYPCKCSGSIKFVHQDCLMEWLSHSNKKYCELCKTPFRFTKLYDSHMPTKLPLHIFLRKAALHTLYYALTWARALAVALVWLVVLPWCIRWSWRGLFWLLDAGWAREAWLSKEENMVLQSSNHSSIANEVESALNESLSSSTTNDPPSEPIALNLSKMLINAFLNPWRPFTAQNGMDKVESASILANAASSTLLSDVKSLNSLTSSPQFDRFILDVLEGQIVTFLIVIAFILVFLIREWVVQQQPIINAAAQLRDAELQIVDVDRAAQRLRERQIQVQQAPEGEIANILQQIVQEANPPEPAQDVPSDSNSDENIPSAADEVAATDGGAVGIVVPPEDSTIHVNQPIEATEEAFDHQENTNPHHEDASSSGSGEGWEAIGDITGRDAGRDIPHNPDEGNVPHGDNILNHHRTAGMPSSIAALGVDDLQETNAQNEAHEGADDISSGDVPYPASEQESIGMGFAEGAPDERDQDSSHAGPTIGENSQQANPDDQQDRDHDNQNHDQAQAADQLHRNNRPNAPNPAPPNPLQRIFNWFWGDIVPDNEDAAQQPADPFDEAVVHNEAEEAPFVRVQNNQGDVVPAQPDDAQDPEVLQAAAEAGLDADAMDDVEDLEGILELIGMQGPLVGLLQTAMFCGVLITSTLWAALGTPYIFGKLALHFLGDPLLFLIIGPIGMVSLISDGVVDSTIYLGGQLTRLIAAMFSQLVAWIMQATYMRVEANTFDFLARRAQNAVLAASGRLNNLFAGEGSFESGFLLVSLRAHQSLHTLQAETAQTTAFFVRLTATVTYHLRNSTLKQMLHSTIVLAARELGQVKKYYTWARQSLPGSFATSINNVGTLTVKVNRDPIRLDPSLAYWSATDRCMTILAGYIFLAMIGTMYLLRKEPLFSSQGFQRVEKGFTDFLKQAGGVLKVILIISIEMLVFPFYCGVLLDFALLPLFGHATVGSRLLFAVQSPWMFAFVHWFIGTCYMFHFALFVSACRRVMRSGVLYFIRDPDDPTFHPVRDVLERNVTTQLRKIAFSALVYGGLVICCLGGVVWGIDGLFQGVFPIRWASPEPLLEFPIDFLIYNLLAPIVARFLLPSQGLEDLFKLWLKRCARGLRLSHFLFGDRQSDEEGRYVQRTLPDPSGSGIQTTKEFVFDGRYVRAPASDQVRIPKGDRVFLEVNAENRRVDGQIDHRTGLHGRKNKNFVKVYVPPWFRARIGLFIFSLWLFAAGTGVGITLMPMIFGRLFLSMTTPERVYFNDLYAFSIGLVTLGSTLWMVLRSRTAYKNVRGNFSKENLTAALEGIKDRGMRALKSLYVYGFALVIVPTLFALVLQLYLVLPLHTYTSSWSTSQKDVSGGLGGMVNASASATGSTTIMPTTSSLVAGHSIHVLQDWTLGFLYGRVVLRLLMLSRHSRPATALRLITRDGYTNPNAALATRAFVAPTLLLFSVVLLLPPVFATIANSIFFAIDVPTDSFPQTFRVKVYRYSYPLCASQALALWGAWEFVKATQRWRNKIKDEVYLIGERLHNFGEKRAADGAKNVDRSRAIDY